MIELHQYHPALGLPNTSPFCLKIEALLRLLDIEYRNSYVDDPRKFPYGKLPVVRRDGELRADSRLIAPWLRSLSSNDPDTHLDAGQRAHAHALGRMLEEQTYFAVAGAVWLDDTIWPQYRDALFAGVPKLVRAPVAGMIRRSIRRDLHGQGTGRLDDRAVHTLVQEDLAALDGTLGDKPYFFGDAPVSFDATAFAFLAVMAHIELQTPLHASVEQWPRLIAYADRMKVQLWPEGYPESK